jgi:hypothetical protein
MATTTEKENALVTRHEKNYINKIENFIKTNRSEQISIENAKKKQKQIRQNTNTCDSAANKDIKWKYTNVQIKMSAIRDPPKLCTSNSKLV